MNWKRRKFHNYTQGSHSGSHAIAWAAITTFVCTGFLRPPIQNVAFAVPRFCVVNGSIGTKRAFGVNKMRKFFVPLTLLFTVINIIAQEHLSFKGIPIEGSMMEFCQKLKTKGFTQIGHDNNVTLFTGDFTGRNSTVGVGATDDGKRVHSVIVIFDESREWNTLVNTYDYYKGLYIRK